MVLVILPINGLTREGGTAFPMTAGIVEDTRSGTRLSFGEKGGESG